MNLGDLSGVQGMVKLAGLWESDVMKKPELTDVGWVGPSDQMDRASHRFGQCTECHETICVEQALPMGRTLGKKPMKRSTMHSAHTLS